MTVNVAGRKMAVGFGVARTLIRFRRDRVELYLTFLEICTNGLFAKSIARIFLSLDQSGHNLVVIQTIVRETKAHVHFKKDTRERRH